MIPESMMEDPFEPVDVDMMRMPPQLVLQKMAKITNAIVERTRQYNENRQKIADLKKSDPLYPALNKERNLLDDDMEALKKKYDFLDQVMYTLGAEMRMAAKPFQR